MVVAAAALAGFDAAVSAAAGGLAVLLPDLMYQVQLLRLQRAHPQSFAFLAMRYKLIRLFSTVLFLAVSLQLLGSNIVALPWMMAVAAQALLAPIAILLLLRPKAIAGKGK